MRESTIFNGNKRSSESLPQSENDEGVQGARVPMGQFSLLNKDEMLR
jgi:hypothetical protein